VSPLLLERGCGRFAPMVRKIVSEWPSRIFELSDVKILIYLYERKKRRDATILELRHVVKHRSTLLRSLRSLLDYGLIEKKKKSEYRNNVTYALNSQKANPACSFSPFAFGLIDAMWLSTSSAKPHLSRILILFAVFYDTNLLTSNAEIL
jgi:DNA-binding HxlR family transcriptional regulator